MVLDDLYEIIKERKVNAEEGSYTKYLFNKGIDKILKKVGEECTELIIAAKGNDKDEIISEICDLTYHILVLMAEKEINLGELNNELSKRRNKMCRPDGRLILKIKVRMIAYLQNFNIHMLLS